MRLTEVCIGKLKNRGPTLLLIITKFSESKCFINKIQACILELLSTLHITSLCPFISQIDTAHRQGTRPNHWLKLCAIITPRSPHASCLCEQET